MLNNPFGNMWTRKFSDIYSNVNDFTEDYTSIGIPQLITQANVETLYYLLYAQYGNNAIANFDENQFKYKLFTLVFMYGPTWEKKLDIQAKIRALDETAIVEGSTQINNQALAQGQKQTNTTNKDGLDGINQQFVTMFKKDKISGYANLLSLLENDVTKPFLDKFKTLFRQILQPDEQLYYTTIEED